MRRRWASKGDDPGRVARSAASENGAEPAERRRKLADAIREEFLGRSIVIDCPHEGCHGMLLTVDREIEHPGGSSSRVMFRCTRQPEAHLITVAMEPYTQDEVERLKASLLRAEQPACVRCGTPLELQSAGTHDGWEKSLDSGAAFYCSWCGLRWVAPAELGERVS